MTQGDDLQHVLAVLEGRAPQRATSPPRSRGGGGSRGRGGKRGRASASPGARRPQQERQSRQYALQRQGGASGSSRGGGTERHAGGPQHQRQQQQATSDAASGPYSEPGPQSTHRVWHCSACDVWVPRREGDWEVHCRGIRHQRQLLSLRVHGQRGKLVLSTFESAPGPSDPAYRLVGKGAVQFGLAGLAGPAAAPLPAEQQAAAKKLRTQALAQLLNLYGVGQTYNAAAAAFSEQLLAAALREVPVPSAAQVGGAGAAAEKLALSSAASLAAAAQRVQEGSFQSERAQLQVHLEGQGFGAVAACFAALRLLLGALGSAPSLAHLTLRLRHGAMHAMPAYQLAQLERAWGAHVVRSLGGLLEQNPGLRSIRVEVPPCLVGPSQQQLPSLWSVARAAPLACRQHLLLALHPRVGRCSLLQLLPLPLVGEIMELAAPLEPCVIAVVASEEGAEPAPGG